MSLKSKRHYIRGNWSEEAKLLYRFFYDTEITGDEEKDKLLATLDEGAAVKYLEKMHYGGKVLAIDKLIDKLDEKLYNKTEAEIKGYLEEVKQIRSKEIFSQLENWHPGLIWGKPAPEGFKPGDEY